MQAIMKCIRHNQGIAVSTAICLVLLIWSFGCESKVRSLTKPGTMVTRSELVIEVQELALKEGTDLEVLEERAKLRFDKLDQDDALRQKLFDFAALAAESGKVSTGGIITLVGSILGLGFAVDNRIKDKVIKNRSKQV